MKKYLIIFLITFIFAILGFITIKLIFYTSKKTNLSESSEFSQQQAPAMIDASPTPLDQNAPFASPITKTASENSYTLNEVAKHAIESDCWLAIDGNVYDVTTFIPDQPGGQQILVGCGKDASALFNERHLDQARALLPEYLIGKVGK